MNALREIAYQIDPVRWVRDILDMTPTPWQETFLRSPRGASILRVNRAASGQNNHRGLGNCTFHGVCPEGRCR